MNMVSFLTAVGGGSAWVFILLALLCSLVTGIAVFHLLLLLGAAANAARTSRKALPADARNDLRFVVVIPAHNEELVLESTLDSLRRQNYPRDRYEVVVIADNCNDRTAEIARSCGVTVMERMNKSERGKGYALTYAFAHLLQRPNTADGYAIVDADTQVAPDFLAQMADYLGRHSLGTRYALQGRYGVLNRNEGWRAALMAAAFELFNHIRPLGADRLGFLVGLKGNGMMFSRETLETVAWGHSVTEDIDYGLDLLRAGIRMRYVPHAVVQAQMPVTAEQAASQRERWEMGRFRLIRDKALPLFGEAFRRRRPVFAEAAITLASPPLAELCLLMVAGAAFWAAASLLGSGLTALALPLTVAGGLLAFSGGGFLFYILAGLRLAGAGKEAYAALLRAPFYALWKFALYIPGMRKRVSASSSSSGPATEWVRTERHAMPASSVPPIETEASR